MTEKEKMLSGELYHTYNDANLYEERMRAQDLCFQYNNILPSNIREKVNLIRKIVNKTGDSITVEQPFWCDYGFNIEFGENFYSNHNLIILDPAKVIFGNNVFVGPNCSFYTAVHPMEYELRNKGYEYAKPINVGNNVWIGGNVVVLPGVNIGDNVVIGAGSIVTKDIPSNSLAFGNPCKVIRPLNSEGIEINKI